MSDDVPISTRVPAALNERLEALSRGAVKKAAVIRRALEIGLDVIEKDPQELVFPGGSKQSRKKP